MANNSSMAGPKGAGIGIVTVYQNFLVGLILECVEQLKLGIVLADQGYYK